MRIKHAFLAAAALCLAAPALAAAPAAAVSEINAVVRQFQAAIVARDGEALGRLFKADHNSWLVVLDDEEYAAARARDATAAKVRTGSWREFADMIAHSAVPVEERFHNVRIDTNGAVGSVYFDFDFLMDGKLTNRGSEAWQMVRDEQGWKIGAMVFSVRH